MLGCLPSLERIEDVQIIRVMGDCSVFHGPSSRADLLVDVEERISRLHSGTSDQNLEIVPNFQDVHSLMRRSWLALESREVLRHHRPVGGTVS